MGENNEHIRVMDMVIGALLFCIVLMCVISLVVLVRQKENKIVQDMHDATSSSEMARLNELALEDEPVLCTAVANVLSEFGDTELLYIAIRDIDGTTLVYTYPTVTVSAVSGSYVLQSSKTPVIDAVKKLLSYSDRTCKLGLGEDSGLSYALITVN